MKPWAIVGVYAMCDVFILLYVCKKNMRESLQLNICPYNKYWIFETDLNVVTWWWNQYDLCHLAGSVGQ